MRAHALRYPHADLYILHLRLDGSAERLKLGCNHADSCNRRIHPYCGSARSVRRAPPPTGTRRNLKVAKSKVGIALSSGPGFRTHFQALP